MTVIGSAALELRGDTAQFVASVQRASATFTAFGRNLETRLGKFDKRMETGFGALGKRMDSVASSWLKLSVAIGVAGGVVVAAATKIDTLKRSLVAVAGSTEEANRQLGELREVAKLPGLGFAEAIQGAVRLQAVGVEANNSIRILKAFGNAIATTGGGKAELDRVTLQIGQLSAKSKILSQDLRPIIEAAPAVGKALKQAFGTVDSQEIENLGLTTEQFLDQLTTQLEKLPRVTGGARNAFENLQDSLMVAANTLGRILLPASAALANATAKLAEKVEGLSSSTVAWGVAIATVVALGGPLLLLAAKLVTTVAALSAALSVGLLPLIGVGGAVIVGLGLLASAFLKSKIEALAAADAVKTFNDRLAGTSQPDLQRQINIEETSLESLRAEKKARQDALAVARQFGATVSDDMSDISLKIQVSEIHLGALRDRMKELKDAAGGAGAGVAIFTRALSTQPLQVLIDALDDARGKLRDLEFESGLPQTAEDAVQLTTAINATRKQVAALEAAFGSLGETRARALTSITPSVKPIDVGALTRETTFSGISGDLTRVRPVGRDSGATSILPGLSKIREEAAAAAAAVKTISPALETVNAKLQSVALAGADAFADFATGSKNALHDFVESAMRDLARLAVRLAIVRTLQVAFPGSGFVTGLAEAAGLAKRASGGPVMKNHAYLVGERGPEVFVPAGAGNIVANGNLGGGGGSFDASSLPPYPRKMTPGELAVDDYWRRFFSLSVIDHRDRGGR